MYVVCVYIYETFSDESLIFHADYSRNHPIIPVSIKPCLPDNLLSRNNHVAAPEKKNFYEMNNLLYI